MHPGCPHDDFRQCSFTTSQRSTFRVNGSTVASPGYFAINLTNTVGAEMTTTQRTAIYRFTFLPHENVTYRTYQTEFLPSEQLVAHRRTVPSHPLILIDLVDLSNSRRGGGAQVYEESGRIIGDGTFNPSFGTGEYQAYFCADFRGAKLRDSGTFTEGVPVGYPKYIANADSSFDSPTGTAGAWVQFERTDQVLARVGLSFISVDQACANAEEEIPDFDFDRVVEASRIAWGKKLSVIELDATGVSEETQTVFWSGLYRSMLSPQNYTGENPLWNSTEPYYDSFYCIWDSFRAQHPLLTIVDPVAQAEMVRSLIDIYRFAGALPGWLVG